MADKKIIAGIFATLLASLCCITPVLALLAGSSSLASSFSWMEPYHNYLVGLTVLILLYAWWDKLKSRKQDIDCACDEKGKSAFFSSKKFLAIVTLFSAVMLTFPQWGYKYFKTEEACSSCTVELKEEPAVDESETDNQEPSVLKYMRDDKINPVACNQKACTGTGRKEVDALIAQARSEVEEMSPAVFKKMLDNEEKVILLDVREAGQRAEGEIYCDESYAIARGDVEFEIMNTIKDKNAVIVVFSRAGARSLLAAQTLKHLGYAHVYNLQNGLKGWVRAGYPFDNALGVVLKVDAE